MTAFIAQTKPGKISNTPKMGSKLKLPTEVKTSLDKKKNFLLKQLQATARPVSQSEICLQACGHVVLSLHMQGKKSTAHKVQLRKDGLSVKIKNQEVTKD